MKEYEGKDIIINEWPNPCCEIMNKHNPEMGVHIRSIEDAAVLISSLQDFITHMSGRLSE